MSLYDLECHTKMRLERIYRDAERARYIVPVPPSALRHRAATALRALANRLEADPYVASPPTSAGHPSG